MNKNIEHESGLTGMEKLIQKHKKLAEVQEAINQIDDFQKVKATILCCAKTAVAEFPQYDKTFHDGLGLFCMKRDVLTKGGVAFKKGDSVLVDAVKGIDITTVSAWSIRLGCHVSINISDMQMWIVSNGR